MLLTNKRYTVRITVEDEKQFNSAVYDFDDTFYESDLNGVLLKEIPAKKQLESDAEEAAPI